MPTPPVVRATATFAHGLFRSGLSMQVEILAPSPDRHRCCQSVNPTSFRGFRGTLPRSTALARQRECHTTLAVLAPSSLRIRTKYKPDTTGRPASS
jgi:hypothetical protein